MNQAKDLNMVLSTTFMRDKETEELMTVRFAMDNYYEHFALLVKLTQE